MTRYIDADRLNTKIHELYVQPNIELWQVVKCVNNSPTADVVPKSEVEEYKHCWEKIHDSYTADCLEHYNRGRAEVAREIFEEIDKFTYRYLNDADYSGGDMIYDLNELKKQIHGG